VEEKYLIFNVRDKRFAVQSKIISEVAVFEKVFPLPLVPGYVRGIINRYSVPYALIDISFLLLKETSNARKVIVLKEEMDKLAFLIDDVTDIADLPPDKLMKIEQEETAAAGGEPGNADARFFASASGTGLVSSFFEWKDSSVFCLDTGEIINRIKRDFNHSDV